MQGTDTVTRLLLLLLLLLLPPPPPPLPLLPLLLPPLPLLRLMTTSTQWHLAPTLSLLMTGLGQNSGRRSRKTTRKSLSRPALQ